ncbi:MAG: hypothetical protein K2Q23_08270, partial [Bryobacteraceae bacterium]|nr:hypothetical protein [Bryobacteraceae bacterium]
MIEQQPPEPPAIVRKKPPAPEEDEAVFVKMRDLVIGQQNAAEIQRLREETQDRLIRPQGGPLDFVKELYG